MNDDLYYWVLGIEYDMSISSVKCYFIYTTHCSCQLKK